MKISWGQVGAAAAAMALLAGAYRVSPAVRTTAAKYGREWFSWTEETRRADPAGFTRRLEHKLKTPLSQAAAAVIEFETTPTAESAIQQQQWAPAPPPEPAPSFEPTKTE